MKALGSMLKTACLFSLTMVLLCAFVYPAALTGASQILFKEKAGGSLVDADGNLTADAETAVGSALVGQDFTEDCFFKGRISAVHGNTYREEEATSGEYGGVSSGSFNYGNSNPALKERVEADLAEFLKTHPGVSKEEVPADLLTASGSGLDPHISPEAARIQVGAVADHSGLSKETVEAIVAEHTEGKFLGIFGEERVNVLGCNLAIARAMERMKNQ